MYNNVIKFLKKTALVTISGLAHPSRISIGGFFIIAYLFVKDNRGPWAQICFAANRLCCSHKRRPNIMLKPAFKSVYLLAMLSYHKTRRHFCCCWPWEVFFNLKSKFFLIFRKSFPAIIWQRGSEKCNTCQWGV